MRTEILSIFEISKAIDCLKQGDPIAFPTETVYGLGANVFDEEAVGKIFSIKGRPSDNPLIAHIAFLEEAARLGEGLGVGFYALAESFWPGPLAIVVKKKDRVPARVSAGHPTIAIRMPDHRIARELIEGVGEPLVAPSANLSGRPSPTSAQDVLEDLDGKVRYVLDGGRCSIGIESTVISLVGKEPVILRPGHICQEALEEVLECKVAHARPDSPILSPGMKYRHYAPKAKVVLVFKKEELKGPFFQPSAPLLYSQLREADRQGWETVEFYCDETVQKDVALMNRLLRASGLT